MPVFVLSRAPGRKALHGIHVYRSSMKYWSVLECLEELKGAKAFQLNLGGAYALIRDPGRSAGTDQGRES